MDFMANFNCLTNKSRKNIFVKQDNNDYYNYEEGVYIYNIEKKVIDKTFFQKSYYEYLNLQNKTTVAEHFLSLISQDKKIKEKYSFREIEKEVLENYEDFYIRNRESINALIGEDLLNYSKYLGNYIEESNKGPVLKRKIESSFVTLTFKLSKLKNDFIFDNTYFNNSYYLSLDDVWNELKDKNYPKIYM